MGKKHCPFEELGCKFGHEINLQLIDRSKQLEKITEKINKTDRDIFKPDKFDVNSDKSYLNTSEEKNKVVVTM